MTALSQTPVPLTAENAKAQIGKLPRIIRISSTNPRTQIQSTCTPRGNLHDFFYKRIRCIEIAFAPTLERIVIANLC